MDSQDAAGISGNLRKINRRKPLVKRNSMDCLSQGVHFCLIALSAATSLVSASLLTAFLSLIMPDGAGDAEENEEGNDEDSHADADFFQDARNGGFIQFFFLGIGHFLYGVLRNQIDGFEGFTV